MKALLLIAGDSVRALLHRRLLLALMIASLAVTVAFSVMFARTTIDLKGFPDQPRTSTPGGGKDRSDAERRRMRDPLEQASLGFQTAFYAVTGFGGSLVALFIFGTAVSTEIRTGTIRLTLARPVSRLQFLLGKFLGGVIVMAGYTILASAAMLAFAYSQHMTVSPAMQFAPWLMFCKQLMLGSVALLLSLFVHPLIAAILAFFAGNGFYAHPNPLYYVLPSYGDFDLYGEIFSGKLVSASDVAFLTLYAADFTAIMLLLALWRFRTRELL